MKGKIYGDEINCFDWFEKVEDQSVLLWKLYTFTRSSLRNVVKGQRHR